MKNPYVKLSLILPKNKTVKSIKKFPILDQFKAKEMQVFVRPSKNEKFHIIDVFITQ